MPSTSNPDHGWIARTKEQKNFQEIVHVVEQFLKRTWIFYMSGRSSRAAAARRSSSAAAAASQQQRCSLPQPSASARSLGSVSGQQLPLHGATCTSGRDRQSVPRNFGERPAGDFDDRVLPRVRRGRTPPLGCAFMSSPPNDFLQSGDSKAQLKTLWNKMWSQSGYQ